MNISYIKSPPRKFLKFLYSFFFYPMNSALEQCPNSDPKQCTVTKLGWVQSAHTQNPGRMHTERAVPMSWALLRAQQACRTRSQRRSRVQRAQVACIAPRSWAHVETSFPCPVPGQIATSFLGRNLLDD